MKNSDKIIDIDKIINDAYYYIDNTLKPIINNSYGEGNPFVEGNIFDLDEKFIKKGDNSFIEKRRNVVISCQNKINALEIGFNSGFSALLILLSNPNIKLTCVDINLHNYVIPCFNQLKKDFGDRIRLLIGDSCSVVPSIVDKFDLVHIDGGHSVNVAECDIINTYKLLMNNAVIIMDDVDIYDNNQSLANLWKHYVNIFSYKEPTFDLFISRHHDVRVYTNDS